MSQLHQSAVRNRFLAALPPDDFALLAPSLRPVDLDLRQVLHEAERPIAAAYFPEAGMVSMIAALEDGALQEVGVVGLVVVLGADSSPLEALAQAPGPALRMSAAGLRAAFDRSPTLRAALPRHVQAFHLQVARTAACNGRHALEERLARWLLMAHDRAGGGRFPVTQEFIVSGVWRTQVARIGRMLPSTIAVLNASLVPAKSVQYSSAFVEG